jgi:hypothetical protein
MIYGERNPYEKAIFFSLEEFASYRKKDRKWSSTEENNKAADILIIKWEDDNSYDRYD